MNISLMKISDYDLLEYWEEFMDECSDCYSWDYSEYCNEIYKRDIIQSKIDNGEFTDTLLEKLTLLDQRFKKLLQENVTLPKGKYWWNMGVLKLAGESYCYYMLSTYGIVVSEC